MRTLEEITEIGLGALVQALGREDAGRFLLALERSAAPTRPVARDESAAAEEEGSSMTLAAARQRIRDMHEPGEQESRL